MLVAKFLENTNEGKLWLDAINRIANSDQQRRFPFLPSESYLSRLPSIPAHRAFPEINSHIVRIPKHTTDVITGRNVRVERNGRITFAHGQVFYPFRAPYSHISLLENYNAEQRSFQHSLEKVQRFNAKLDPVATQECLDKVLLPGVIYPCSDDLIAVDTVVVISQTLGSQMFHYMCENLPRLGALLPFVEANKNAFVHVSCPENSGYCLPLLEVLGIPATRVVRGNVLAKTVILPEGGRRHWPISNLYGLLALRAKLLGNEAETCFDHGDTVKIAIMKRKLTRLSNVKPDWYDKLQSLFQLETALQIKIKFNVTAEFILFDDADSALMSDAKKQIDFLRKADVVVGAHGAAFSWMTYLKRCTHFISFRGRANSDIFEHLALGLGMAFHHILFDNEFNSLFQQLQHNIQVAVAEFTKLLEQDAALLVCEDCDAGAIDRHLLQFAFVVTRTKLALQNNRVKQLHANLAWQHQIRELFPNATTIAWVKSGSIVLKQDVMQDYVATTKFDATIFISKQQPMFAVFRNDQVMHTFDDALQVDIFTFALPHSIALVLCDATAAQFQVPTQQQAIPIDKDNASTISIGILLRRQGIVYHQAWPSSAFVREPPSAQTLGEFGEIVQIEIPFTV